MAKGPEEWFKQAEYDIKTAEAMFAARRYVYVVFMCHLSIEKALKGLYQKRLGTIPPKVHNLLYLIEAIGIYFTRRLIPIGLRPQSSEYSDPVSGKPEPDAKRLFQTKDGKIAGSKQGGFEMAPKRAKEVVKFLTDCLKEKGLKVSKIIVFGSQAKGTATEESDIDIVIVSEDFRRKEYFQSVLT